MTTTEGTPMTQAVAVAKVIDLRPVDFVTGKRLAVPRCDWAECQACGNKVVRLAELTTGHRIGLDCAEVIKVGGVARMAAIGWPMKDRARLFFVALGLA